MFSLVTQSGKANYLQYPRNKFWWKPMSALTIALVGGVGKLFWRKHRFHIEDQHILHEALKQAKLENRSVLTVMNHVSILDDPLVWSGFVKMNQFLSPDSMRWVLGAKNICFKNKLTSWFFSLGQVLSVERFGHGPFQPALDTAVWLANRGQWIHMFPEGFVHQPYPPHENTQKYFKWGVSRIALEPERPPIIVPIYGVGLEKVFPEDLPKRAFGYGSRINVRYRIGTPIAEQQIKSLRDEWGSLCKGYDKTSYLPQSLQTGEAAEDLRSRTAYYLRQELLKVRRAMGFSDETLEMGMASFWKSNENIMLKQLKEKDPRKQKI